MCFCFSSRESEHFNINEKIEEKRFVDGSTEYYKDSYLHNDNDRPAVVHGKHKEWWFHGMRHRVSDNPAITYKDGSKEWWFHGMRHREGDKPAVVLKEESFNYTFFSLEWWFYGKLHREGGKPAIMRADGTQEYWEYGRRIK